MRFWTILTLPAATVWEKLRRLREWQAQVIAARLPVRVRYWVTLQEIGRATMKSPNVPATPLDEILRNLATPNNLS